MPASSATRTLLTARPGREALIGVLSTAVTLAGTLVLLVHGGVFPGGFGRVDAIGVLLAVCSTAPLIAWRRFPTGIFVTTAVAGVALVGLGYPADLLLGSAAALYLLAAGRGSDQPWTRSTTATVVVVFAAYLAVAAVTRGTFPTGELIHTGTAWAAAWFAGERTRLRREQVAVLRQRAVRAEREAERERRLAAAEERARIARDLHDSAGHAISVIAVRAGAARMRHHSDPDRSLETIEAIETIARQTVEEIDQMVSALREGQVNGTVEAPTGLASLDALIAHHTEAGLEVRLDVSGERRTLGGVVDQAAYRILQESMLNAARHGAGRARVRLDFTETAVELTVSNPVSNPVPDAVPAGTRSRPGGGHGLIGMRERSSMVDGTFETERTDGEFLVRARLPYEGPAR